MPEQTDPNLSLALMEIRMSAVEATVVQLGTGAAELRRDTQQAQAALLKQIGENNTGIKRIQSHLISELGGKNTRGQDTVGRVNENINDLREVVEKIALQLAEIDVALRGTVANGNRGLLTRVDSLEATDKRRIWWVGAITTGLLSLFAKLLYDFLTRGG